MKHTVGDVIKLGDLKSGKVIEAVITKISGEFLYVRRKDNKAFKGVDGTYYYNVWIRSGEK